MNSLGITHQRLNNQQILHTKFTTPGQLVSWLGAIQAQDYKGAKWAIGLRLSGITDKDVEQAIANKTVVRTWPMRGTLHFVAPNDVRWMLELLTPRVIAKNSFRYKQLELNDGIFQHCIKLSIKALQGNKQLTRYELMNFLEKSNININGQRGIHIIGWLAQKGYICFGPIKGKQQTFVLLDEWLPKSKKLTRDLALAEITRRYFVSHGHATIQDFAWWTGLTIKNAKTGIDMNKTNLISEIIEDTIYWMSSNIQIPKNIISNAYLLPAFDEYIISYKNRSAMLNPIQFKDKVHGMGGMFIPTIIFNGQVIGTWKQILKKTEIIVTSDLFTSPNRHQKNALILAIDRYKKFFDIPIL